MAQLHKRFTDHQVREMLQRYCNGEIERAYLQTILGISKSQFFFWLQQYRARPETFSVRCTRQTPPRRLDARIEANIVKELTIDQQAIRNPQVPLRAYNYSYVQRRLQTHYRQTAARSPPSSIAPSSTASISPAGPRRRTIARS